MIEVIPHETACRVVRQYFEEAIESEAGPDIIENQLDYESENHGMCCGTCKYGKQYRKTLLATCQYIKGKFSLEKFWCCLWEAK